MICLPQMLDWGRQTELPLEKAMAFFQRNMIPITFPHMGINAVHAVKPYEILGGISCRGNLASAVCLPVW